MKGGIMPPKNVHSSNINDIKVFRSVTAPGNGCRYPGLVYRSPMNAVERAFTLLETIAERQEEGMSFPELAAALGYAGGTLHRLLGTLSDLHYLHYDEGRRKYHVGLRMAHLGARVTSSHSLHKVGHAHLEQLFQKSGHTCSLGVPEQDHGVYIDVLTTTRYGVKLLSEVGREFSLHCTAQGKLFLAFADHREALMAGLPDSLPAYTSTTLTCKADLAAQVRQVAEQGYAIDDEEAFRGMICFAAPVFDYTSRLIAAVSLSCPHFAVETAEERERLIALVRESGKQLSKAFGFGDSKGQGAC